MRFDDINDYFNTRNISYLEAVKNKKIVDCYKPIDPIELYLNKEELYSYISKVASIKISSFKNPEIKIIYYLIMSLIFG